MSKFYMIFALSYAYELKRDGGIVQLVEEVSIMVTGLTVAEIYFWIEKENVKVSVGF